MNSSEMFNREKKAAKLAKACFRIRATAEDVLSADAEDWRHIAALATEWCEEPTNPPNEKNPKPTVDAVIAALARLYDAERDMEYEGEPKTAQQEADEAAEADDKAEAKWEESQEYAGNRCPERE